MKHLIHWAFLATVITLWTPEYTEANTVTIPWGVVQCYRSLYRDIVDGNITSEKVKEYVNPENVLIDMRNPVNDSLKEKVIQSAKNFALFLAKKINENTQYTWEDIVFTRYKEWSHKVLLEWKIADYNFKLYLEPNGECKVLDFTVAWVKWMRDFVPRK